jgi:hypothetical protein
MRRVDPVWSVEGCPRLTSLASKTVRQCLEDHVDDLDTHDS